MKIAEMSVEYIDHMGSDLSVVNAARVSFDKESHWEYEETNENHGGKTFKDPHLSEQDKKLISYLAKHNHWSPFAHCMVSLRIKAPIFVARQLVKHQVGLAWNEVSRRYVDSEPEFWFPNEWRGKPVNAKQGSEGIVDLSSFDFEGVTNLALQAYTELLSREAAPEQARMVLPQNTMTSWVWTGSLYAFARVCNLRLDSHAQLESQEVAQKISDIIKPLFPVSWSVLVIDN